LALNSAIRKIEEPQNLPAARVLNEMISKNESHCDFISRYSHIHQNTFINQPLSLKTLDFYQQLAVNSFQEQVALEADEMPFKDFLSQFLKI